MTEYTFEITFKGNKKPYYSKVIASDYDDAIKILSARLEKNFAKLQYEAMLI